MVSEFPSNRHKDSKPDSPKIKSKEEKKVTRVTQGEVVRRKKPLGKRFAELFVGGSAKSAWSYVAFDVIVPAAKDMLADAVSQGVERMVFGETRSRSRSGRHPTSGYTNYSNRYSPAPNRRPNVDDLPRHAISQRGRAAHDFDEIILATRVEAEEVLDRLYDIVSRYESATVLDLYELVGIPGNYTDDKWGWLEFPGAGVARVRGGYLLDLPKPEPLD